MAGAVRAALRVPLSAPKEAADAGVHPGKDCEGRDRVPNLPGWGGDHGGPMPHRASPSAGGPGGHAD